MAKRKVFIGFALGIAANMIGMVLYIFLFLKTDNILTALRLAYKGGFLGSVIALGAILNLMLFLVLIRKRKDAYARGVLMATIVVALLLLMYKLVL